jgi:hypothetical protein
VKNIFVASDATKQGTEALFSYFGPAWSTLVYIFHD